MPTPTCKIVLFGQPNLDGKHTVYLRITYAGRHRYRTLNRHATPTEWDSEHCRFTKTFPNWKVDNDILRMYEQRAADILRALERDQIPFDFDNFDAEMFKAQTTKSAPSPLLVSYTESIANELVRENRYGNSLIYRNLAHLFSLYKPKTTLGEISEYWLTRFEHYQRTERSMAPGGIYTNMRTLRAICNRAIKAGIMRQDWYPFKNYGLGHLNKPTRKRAIPLDDIKRIHAAELTGKEAFARDLFIFSLYARGMNLVDIAHLKPENLTTGRIEYTRRKTHQLYSIALNSHTVQLLEQYAGGLYCFPILTDFHQTPKQQQERIHRVMVEVNQCLRNIVETLGLNCGKISFYTARHTYASALKELGVSKEIISESLGHTNLRTTEIYLKQFDHTTLDKADELLL